MYRDTFLNELVLFIFFVIISNNFILKFFIIYIYIIYFRYFITDYAIIAMIMITRSLNNGFKELLFFLKKIETRALN